MNTINWSILFFQILLFATSCSRIEKDPTSKVIANSKSSRALRDSCFEQVNKYLTGLLHDPVALKKQLNLSADEVSLITNPQSKAEIHKFKGRLIEKLIPLITDTTDLKIFCESLDIERVRLGDLALLCIYRVEEFPFFLALSRQWCTGGAISDNIQLPFNLIEYTNFEREKIKESYTAYYHGEERTLYLKEKIGK